MKFLVLGGYSQSRFAVLWSQLNMAVIVFSKLKCLRKPGEASVISEMLGIWNDAFLGRKVFIGITFFLFFSLRFKKGFESEPTLHSGINYAVLLLAAGHQFDTSFELRKVGEWTLHWISVLALIDVINHIYSNSKKVNEITKGKLVFYDLHPYMELINIITLYIQY